MAIQSGTCYFTLEYVVGFQSRLPELFTGGLNDVGNGVVVIRYGGKRIAVMVRNRELQRGWKSFIKHGNVKSGNVMLASHSGGRIISILRFKRGVGMSSPWDSNGDVFDIDSGLVEEDEYPSTVMPQPIRTSYFPRHVPLFYSRISGVCVFEQSQYIAMKAPMNLAQHLRSSSRNSVDIRSGDRVFAGIEFGMGYFRGQNWRHLIEDCGIEVGFKMFFFINEGNEFQLIVVGNGDLEAVYEWSRMYYKLN